MSEDWKKILSESWGEAKAEVKRICSGDPPMDDESGEKLVPDEDVPEEKIESEEEVVEDEQAVEQDVDVTSEQPPAGHMDTEKTPEGNPENTDDELEQAVEEEQEKSLADEAGEKLDV